jgi:hypothetical protein
MSVAAFGMKTGITRRVNVVAYAARSAVAGICAGRRPYEDFLTAIHAACGHPPSPRSMRTAVQACAYEFARQRRGYATARPVAIQL